MRRILVALAAVALLAVPAMTRAQTVTPGVAATPASDAGQRRDAMGVMPGGITQAPAEFDAGVQVGTTAAGASRIDFFKRVTCTYDPSNLSTDTSDYVSCAATGAQAGDFCWCSRETTGVATLLSIISCTAFTDSIQFRVANLTAGSVNGAAGVYDCAVIR